VFFFLEGLLNEDHEEPQVRFEPGTFEMRVRRANCCADALYLLIV